MECVLSRLLVPDSAGIVEATKDLKQLMRDPQAIPSLCQVMTSNSANDQVRQYAALLLRKHFGKLSVWRQLDGSSRQVLKSGCLTALVQEGDKAVRMAIAQLVAVMAKHEVKMGNTWNELAQFVVEYVQHQDPVKRMLSMYTVSVLCETTGKHAKTLLKGHLGKMFHAALQDQVEIAFYAVRAMTHLVVHVDSDDLGFFQNLIPLVLQVIEKLIPVDEEKACEAMDIFDELFEAEVAIVVPHIKPIVALGIKIGGEENLDDAIRVKAISFLGRITKLKKKTIVKHKLYTQMINTIFPVICAMDEDEDEEEMNESSSPSMAACQTMDTLALNLPPEKFMHALLAHVQPAIESNEPKKMKGAFNALAVSAEGCSEHIKSKYLVNLLQVIGNGIKHDISCVRNAALYALGQYSEYLQPDISEYASEILPVLFQYMDAYISNNQTNEQKKDIGLDRIFYALEVFCENLNEKLVPFLPDLMKRLMFCFNSQSSIRTRQLCISAIGAAANAVKAEIIPYFDQILPHIKGYLSEESDVPDEDQILLTQSMETLGILARAVGPTQFGPALAEECCRLGLELVAKHDDPDIRKCAFALFAAVAFVVKEKISVVLPKVVELMINSCQSKEGISLIYKEDDLALPNLSDDDDEGKADEEISLDTEDTEEAAEKVDAINVLNSYMEEKVQALLGLKEICSNATNSFKPFLFQSSEEAWNLLTLPDCEVRKAAVEALVEFCIGYNNQNDASSLEALQKSVTNLVPKLVSMIKEDDDVNVVCNCLDELSNLLKACKERVTSIAGHPEMIVECIRCVMNSNCKCMDPDELEGEEEDDEVAEQDELLFQSAGDVLPSLGMAMNPTTFSPYFAGMLPYLLKKSKKQCSVNERSFSAGVLAECVKPLQGVLQHYVQVLLPTLMEMTSDEDDDVRNNAIFGIGELALYGGDVIYPHFANILQTLSELLAREQRNRVVDQIVAAVCRLIVSNKDIVPVKEILPVVFKHLPLKEDDEEYPIVFQCLLLMYQSGEVMIKENLGQILNLAGTVYDTEKPEKADTKLAVENFVKIVYGDMTEEFTAVVSQLPPEVGANLGKILS